MSTKLTAMVLTKHDEPLAVLVCHETDGNGRPDLEVVGKEAPVPAANTLWFVNNDIVMGLISAKKYTWAACCARRGSIKTKFIFF